MRNLTALKDINWKIDIVCDPFNEKHNRYGLMEHGRYSYYWRAISYPGYLNGLSEGVEGKSYWHPSSAKRNWKRFAKINGIKKWKWIE